MQEKNGYFEPNLIDYQPEDLCCGIGLKVDYIDRSLNGGTTLTGTVDILGGNNGLLSTSYSDVTILELTGGGNKESIGIESIDIKYNSWYFPEVTIKFVDIRGNSVLNPMEMTNNKNDKGEAQGKGSFLKGFFMFPYPIFYLSIKGYFGRPVTYRLTVKGVPQAMLNSSSGNFEITVNFIGHMYYYLTDIPMSLLMVAPYIQHSGVNTMLTNNVSTFREFISNSADLMVKIKSSDTMSKNMLEYERLKRVLGQLEIIVEALTTVDGIITRHFEIKETSEDNQITFKIKSPTDENKEEYFKKIFDDGIFKIKSIIDKIKNSVHIDLLIAKNGREYNRAADEFKIYYNFNKDRYELSKVMEDTSSEMADLSFVTNEEKKRLYNETYGFIPTIKEIVKMSIGHLDKLYENVNRCLLTIGNESNQRNLRDITENTDINVNGSKDITVYPFTQFYDYEGKQMWIGNTSARGYAEVKLVNDIVKGMNSYNKEMTEAENEYNYNSIFVYNSPPDGLYSLLSDVGKGNPYKKEMEMLGYSLYEFCFTKRNWAHLGRDGHDDRDTTALIRLFAKRYFLAAALCSDKDYVKNVFPKIEAYNLLACGWDDRVYNNDSIFGHDEDDYTEYKTDFVEMFEEAMYDVQLEMEAALKEDVADYSFSKKLCENQSVTDKFESYTKTYNSLNMRQIVINNIYYTTEWLTAYNGPSICTTAKNEEKYYVKAPTSVYIDDFQIDESVAKMDAYLEKQGVGKVSIFNKRPTINILKPKNKNTKGEIEFNISTITHNSDANEILDVLFENFEFGTSSDKKSLLTNLNEGGVIPFRWLELLLMLRWIDTYDPYEKKSTEDLQLYKYFSYLKSALGTDFYYYRKDEILSRVRVILEIEDINMNLNNLFNETVDVYFPYSLRKGVFGMSAGIAANDPNWFMDMFETEVKGSWVENKETYGEFYEKAHAFETFLKTIREYVKPEIEKNKEAKKTTEEEVDEIKAQTSQKMGIYDILKNLYDRWKFGTDSVLNNKIQINDFIFRDVLNRDISDELEINVDKLTSLLLEIYKGERDMDLYSFLFEICKDTNCLMLSMPFKNTGTIVNNNYLVEKFTPYQYSTVINNPQRSSFVITYRQKPSQHLNFSTHDTGYKDDGIDFTNETIVCGDNGSKLPVFGVTYGLGRQGMFKEIQVSMDKPKVTEQSIASTLAIAEKGAKGSKSLQAFSTHDIFDTYSQHSYGCTVETMGNMQIMPMMYFQLNNIPLFKGGYFITKVEHSINSSGMKTTFTGTRVNKYQMILSKNAKLVTGENNITNTKAGGTTLTVKSDDGTTSGRIFPSLTFDKTNTAIIIRASFGYDDIGQESPYLTKDGFMTMAEINEENEAEENRVDIYHPYNEFREETLKLRSYWGNRKIADALVKKLTDNGYVVDTSEYYSTKDAVERKTFDNLYTRQINGKEMNCICINLTMFSINTTYDITPANAKWGSGNEWVIYKQPPFSQFNRAPMPYADTSGVLAQCIATKMYDAFQKNPYDNFNVKNEPEIKYVDNTRAFSQAQMPSVIGMNLYSSTQEHVKHMGKKAFRDQIVNAYYEGIVSFFDKMKNKITSPKGTYGAPIGKILNTRFEWRDFIHSDTAVSNGIPNIPNESERKNIEKLAILLDTILDMYNSSSWFSEAVSDKKVKINSGFRSETLNKKIGGSSTSQHKTGSAADIEHEDGKDNGILFNFIKSKIDDGTITVGQLIWEYGDCNNPNWIHISLPNQGKKNQILRAKYVKKKTVYEVYEPCTS